MFTSISTLPAELSATACHVLTGSPRVSPERFRAYCDAAGFATTPAGAADALATLIDVARFCNLHDRPKDCVIVYLPSGPAVRVYSVEFRSASNEATIVHDDVRSIQEARNVLGY